MPLIEKHEMKAARSSLCLARTKSKEMMIFDICVLLKQVNKLFNRRINFAFAVRFFSSFVSLALKDACSCSRISSTSYSKRQQQRNAFDSRSRNNFIWKLRIQHQFDTHIDLMRNLCLDVSQILCTILPRMAPLTRLNGEGFQLYTIHTYSCIFSSVWVVCFIKKCLFRQLFSIYFFTRQRCAIKSAELIQLFSKINTPITFRIYMKRNCCDKHTRAHKRREIYHHNFILSTILH